LLKVLKYLIYSQNTGFTKGFGGAWRRALESLAANGERPVKGVNDPPRQQW